MNDRPENVNMYLPPTGGSATRACIPPISCTKARGARSSVSMERIVTP